MPKLALFDMDGTLFDYDGQMKKDLIALASYNEFPSTTAIQDGDLWKLTKVHPHLGARIELIRKQPGWWRDLPKFQLGWDVYQVAEDLGFCTKILTKGPRSKSVAWAEKVECIDRHFGESVPIDIVGKDKKGTYGRVLVDDYPEYVLGWLKYRKRGLAILPKQPVNEGFEHPNAIVYDGNNLHKVIDALTAAYNRESKQHWKDLL